MQFGEQVVRIHSPPSGSASVSASAFAGNSSALTPPAAAMASVAADPAMNCLLVKPCCSSDVCSVAASEGTISTCGFIHNPFSRSFALRLTSNQIEIIENHLNCSEYFNGDYPLKYSILLKIIGIEELND